jgi:MinD-like ATPase involved in chromosome partitioning or flagellar assembly/DNA-binding NarL/FixJ family response regulator
MRAFRLRGHDKPAGRGPSSNGRGHTRRASNRPKQGPAEVPNEIFKFQPLANGARRRIQSGSLPPTAAPAAVVVAERVAIEEPLPALTASKARPRPKSELKLDAIKLEELPEYDDNANGNGSGRDTKVSLEAPPAARQEAEAEDSTPVINGGWETGHLPEDASPAEREIWEIWHPTTPRSLNDISQDTVIGDWEDDDEMEEDHVPKVLVIDRQGQFSADLAKATAGLDPTPEVLRLSRPTEVVEVVAQESPDVLVVAPKEVTGAGLRRLAEVHNDNPRVVVVLSDNGKALSPAQTAACGASDILPNKPTKARFKSRIARALKVAEELRRNHRVITERVLVHEPPIAIALEEEEEEVALIAPEEPAPAPLLTSRPARQHQTGTARVFTVASASGGCGKTFFSTNLAAYLVKATRSRVLLVDLDLQFGEVAIALHLRPQRTIAELIEEEDIAAALPDFVVHHRSGFKVLCAPKDPIAGDRVGPRQMTEILEAARAEFDYIVVDTPPTLNETCLAAFDQSQSLVIMATMDLPSLKNLRVFIQTLEKLSLPADQVSVVINKAESGTGIDLKEIEPLYPQGFAAVLPYARQVSWSLNVGAPILESDPDAQISRKLAETGVKLVPPSPGTILPWAPSNPKPRRGWFMKLLKGSAA